MEQGAAPRDTLFYVCFAGFLGGLLLIMIGGVWLRNRVVDDHPEHRRAEETLSYLPYGALGHLGLAVWRYGKGVANRGERLAPLILVALGLVLVGVTSVIFELR